MNGLNQVKKEIVCCIKCKGSGLENIDVDGHEILEDSICHMCKGKRVLLREEQLIIKYEEVNDLCIR